MLMTSQSRLPPPSMRYNLEARTALTCLNTFQAAQKASCQQRQAPDRRVLDLLACLLNMAVVLESKWLLISILQTPSLPLMCLKSLELSCL
jgi:hypothetical protein